MNFLIILSGGTGSRMNSDIPKQYMEINGKPIIRYTMEQFDYDVFESIVIVVSDVWKKYMIKIINDLGLEKKCIFASAGTSRQASVLNGLNCINSKNNNDIVVIHDAARACVKMELVNHLIEACKNYDGVMPVIPVKDTIYMSKDGKAISSLLNRDELFAGQAPEAFKLMKYKEINKNLSKEELANVRGSSEIAFKNNMSIGLIPGDESNFKITTPTDLERFMELKERGN